MRRSAAILLATLLAISMVSGPISAAEASATAEGGVEITATPASDGSQFSYSIDNQSSVSDATVQFTGVNNVVQDDRSGSSIPSSISVGGNIQPTDGSGKNPKVSITQSALNVAGDVSNSTAMNGPFSTSVSGDYAYVAGKDSDSLAVVDISSPSSPSVVGSVSNSTAMNKPSSVLVSGDYAYVAGRASNSLAVVDISSPSSPSVVGSVSDSTAMDGAISVSVSGDYAYVGGLDSDSLAVVDISSPSSPSVVGSVSDSTAMEGAISVSVSGDYAYVGGLYSDSLTVVDISSSSSPSVVGSVSDSTVMDAPHSTSVSGDYAYVAGRDSDSLAVVDISSQSSPSVVGSVSDSTAMDGPRSVSVSGDYAYVAASNSDSLAVVDISSQSSPSVVGSVSDSTAMEGAFSISVSGDYAYVGGLNSDSLAVISGADAITGSVDIGGESHTFDLSPSSSDKTESHRFDLSTGVNSITESLSEDSYDITLAERTGTVDPSITINGETTADFGSLSKGSTTTLNVDESDIVAGQNHITINTDSPSDGPTGQVNIEYSHNASVSWTTSYESTEFESEYNVTHTFQNATKNAEITIPFDSGRVVSVDNLDIQLDGGGYSDVSSSNYDFNGSAITVDVAGVNGGELPEDTTVDVRSTGRKVSVNNGAINVTDPTQPGSDLSTQIEVTSRSSNFNIDVSETASNRIHYATSSDYSPSEYAVIEASGDQQVFLPDASTNDRLRLNELNTEATPGQGDVRIEVVDAGSEPKIDVSPGPNGGTDPVTYRYYDTTSGSEYLLQSQTYSVTRDSDVAESPAVLEDDDSDEVLSILLDSGGGVGGGGGDSGGVIGGPITQSTGIDIPLIDNSPLAIIGALLALGGGYVFVTRDESTASTSGSSSGEGIGKRIKSTLSDSIPAVGGVVGTIAGGAASVGSGFLRASGKAFFGSAARVGDYVRENPTTGVIIGAAVVFLLLLTGAISVPPGTAVIILVPSFSLVSYLGLQRLGYFSVVVWATTTAMMLILSLLVLGVDFGALINQQTAVLLVLGGLYLGYRLVQAVSKPETINRISIPTRRGDE